MKIKILLGMFFSVAMLTLSGCGGGGGGTPAAVIPPGTPTTVSGTPFKGQFDGLKPSVVKIFGVDANNLKGANPLATTQLDIDGKYGPVNIGTYTGTIVVEVTGTYKDEATGNPETINPGDPPLRAIISDAKSGVQVVNVTPLTELAARKMGDVLTKTTIDSRNASIAALFNVADIFNTKPVDASTGASTTALPEEKRQSLVLAAISQLMANVRSTDPLKTLGQVLDDMSADITVDAAVPTNVTMKERSTLGFKTAMFDFVTVNPLNLSGVKSIENAPSIATPPGAAASRLAHLKISTAGLAPGTMIGGINFTFNLPDGVTLSNDPVTFQVSPGLVVAAGSAAVTGTTSVSLSTFHLPALNTGLVNAQGFEAGKEFINISCFIPATVTTSVAALKTAFITAITSATVTATDLKGAPILGAVTLIADPADPVAIVVF